MRVLGQISLWDSQRTALFDVCIFNADTCSLRNQSLQNVFQMKKNAKKSKYCQAAEARRASFTPIIASCEAIFDNEAEVYLKRLATILSKKWDSCYSRVYAMFELECRYALSDLSAYALEVQELNGKEQGLWIMLLFQ